MDIVNYLISMVYSFLGEFRSQDLIRLIVTFFGVLLGAFLAYSNQNRIEKRKIQESQINACQQALFFLGQLQENLHDIQKEIEVFNKSETRHIDLPIIISGKYEVRVNSESLTFLLYDDDPNIVYLLATMEREYKKLVSSIDRRNTLVESIRDESQWTEKNRASSKQYTDAIYYHFKRCYTFNNGVMEDSLSIFKRKFKKANFVVGVTNVMNK